MRRHSVRFAVPRILASALLLALPVAAGAQAQIEDHGNIRAAVQAYAEAGLPAGNQDHSLSVGGLDPRLRVPRCDRPLEAFLPAGGQLSGHATVGVRCAGTHPWQLYVPVSVQVFDQVLVASRNLPRGSRVTGDDLRLERRDIAPINGGYLGEAALAEGQVLRRPLALGQVLTADMLEPEQLVRRGERVTLVARLQGMEVRMAGKALMNGAAGERIQVRNLSSKLVVEGEVTGTGLVQVNM